MPASAGLAGYLVTTLLLVIPILFLRRGGRLPRGAMTVLVAFVALPAAALTELRFVVPALGAILAALLLDLGSGSGRLRSVAVVGTVLPGLVWAGQLAGLQVTG